MPLTHFKCPDGALIETLDCFAECRMGERCSTMPWLVKISEERPWDGTPHVTQLISGTMESFLNITTPYYVDPIGNGPAFMTLGSAVHKYLENSALEIGHPSEFHFITPGVIQGTVDYLEPNPDGTYNMWDYKTWGSYAVAKNMGIVAIKTGKGKTSNITRKYDPGKVDNFDIAMQMNGYRIELEKLDIHIRDMFVQAIVRDGNTYTAKSRAITESVSKVPVNRLDDDYVSRYFSLKGEALMRAIETWQRRVELGDEFHTMPGDTEPIICSKEENWQEFKCKQYCSVAYACPVGRKYKVNMHD